MKLLEIAKATPKHTLLVVFSNGAPYSSHSIDIGFHLDPRINLVILEDQIHGYRIVLILRTRKSHFVAPSKIPYKASVLTIDGIRKNDMV